MMACLSSYQASGVPCFLDLPHGRKKLRTNAYTDAQLVTWAAGHGIDYLAISYVKSAADLCWDYPSIAKIETAEALEDLPAIAARAAMLLVDRRDLATAVGILQLPPAVAEVRRAARVAGKPLIIASELLLSLLQHNEPTLAEAMDVATCAADYLLLAEETALSANAQYIVNVARELTGAAAAAGGGA